MSQNFKEWTIEDVIKEMKESIGHPNGMKIFRNCILDEGNPTVSEIITDPSGAQYRNLTWDSPLNKTDAVTLSPKNDGSFEGLLVVETVSHAWSDIIGHIVSRPKLMAFLPTSSDADNITKRLMGNYYRIAAVEIDFTQLNQQISNRMDE